MSDFDAAYAKLQARVEATKEDRKRKWEVIQNRSPEIADFLTEMNQAFGKAEQTWVVLDGKRILGPRLMTSIDHWEEDVAWLEAQQGEEISVVDADWFAEKVFDLIRKGQLTRDEARQAAFRLIKGRLA